MIGFCHASGEAGGGGGKPMKIKMRTRHGYCKPVVPVEQRAAVGGGPGDLAEGRPCMCKRYEGSNLRRWRCQPIVQATRLCISLIHSYVLAGHGSVHDAKIFERGPFRALRGAELDMSAPSRLPPAQ